MQGRRSVQYRFDSVAVILLLHTLLTCHRIPALHLPESLLARTWNTVNLELFHTMARIGRALFWGGVSRLYSLHASASPATSACPSSADLFASPVAGGGYALMKGEQNTNIPSRQGPIQLILDCIYSGHSIGQAALRREC